MATTTHDQAEQPTSATNKSTIDFSHRLSDPSLDSSLALIDNVFSMADRANGILSVLFWYLQNPGAGSPPNGALCMAVDAAIKEIEDIKVTVNAYCKADMNKGLMAARTELVGEVA